MNESALTCLVEHGDITFRHPEPHRFQCRWRAEIGGLLIVEEGSTFAEALDRVFSVAVSEGWVRAGEKLYWGAPTEPRVITRVMDDGVKTKDGAA